MAADTGTRRSERKSLLPEFTFKYDLVENFYVARFMHGDLIGLTTLARQETDFLDVSFQSRAFISENRCLQN